MVEISNKLFNHTPEELEKEREMEIVYVYFILDEDHNAVKIGWSCDPGRKLKGYKTSILNKFKLLAFIPYHRKDVLIAEKEFHEVFKEYYIRNEWFRYDSIIKSAIEGLENSATNGHNAIVKGRCGAKR